MGIKLMTEDDIIEGLLEATSEENAGSTFKEDVLALPAGPMWAAIAKKRLGVRVFLSAALAIGGRSLLRGIRRRSRWRR